MIVYVASAWGNRAEVHRVRSHLLSLGHEVNSSWIDVPGGYSEDEIAVREAVRDVAEVREADVVVIVSPSGEDLSRGGHHTELGLALAFGKPVVLVGPRRQVFHFYPDVRHFETLEDFLGEYDDVV